MLRYEWRRPAGSILVGPETLAGTRHLVLRVRTRQGEVASGSSAVPATMAMWVRNGLARLERRE